MHRASKRFLLAATSQLLVVSLLCDYCQRGYQAARCWRCNPAQCQPCLNFNKFALTCNYFQTETCNLLQCSIWLQHLVPVHHLLQCQHQGLLLLRASCGPGQPRLAAASASPRHLTRDRRLRWLETASWAPAGPWAAGVTND